MTKSRGDPDPREEIGRGGRRSRRGGGRGTQRARPTKMIPTKICWLNNSGKFPMNMRIPPLNTKIMFESSPLISRILARRFVDSTFPVKFPMDVLHSAKEGTVETGCSDLYVVIHDFTI